MSKIPDKNKATGLRLNGMGDMVTFQYAKHHTDDAQLKEEARQAIVDIGHDKAIKQLQNKLAEQDVALAALKERIKVLETPKPTYNEYMSSWDFKAINSFPEGANITDLNLNGKTLKLGDHVKTATSGDQYVIVTGISQKKYTSDKEWHSPDGTRPQ